MTLKMKYFVFTDIDIVRYKLGKIYKITIN